MTLDQFCNLLKQTGLPVYNQTDGISEIPKHNFYIKFYEDGFTPICADNRVYAKIPHFAVELYQVNKNPDLEEIIEQIFYENRIPVISYSTRIDELSKHVTLWETELI